MSSRTFRIRRTATEVGCDALGYVEREDCRDAVEEEIRYETYLKNKGLDVISVGDGVARVGPRGLHLEVGGTPAPDLSAPQAYDDLLALGCQMDHHESDLYVKDTAEARAVLKKHGVRFHAFRSESDGMREWLEVPFAWAPFWRAKAPAKT